MSRLIKFIVVLVIAITLPLEGFAAALPACALMSHSETSMNMSMQQMQAQQSEAQTEINKSPSQNCDCDCKHMTSQACAQSMGCTSCVTAVFAVSYYVPTKLLKANIYLSGFAIHGPPLVTSSHFRPPITASA